MTLNAMQVEAIPGEIFVDRNARGKERPWRKHKMANELLGIAYGDVDPKKAVRLKECAANLKFKWQREELRYKLFHAWFCRVRLCPMCAWRRSLKVAGQMNRIMEAIKMSDEPKAYIMLTLTMKNCQPDELGNAIDCLMYGFNKLSKSAEYKAAVHGHYKAVEVTHNISEDTYHPHIHAVLAVNPSYFSGKKYIKQDRWTELWKRSIQADYVPIVDVRKVKGDTSKAVAEVAKYAVKTNEYIIPDDWDMTVDTVRLLDGVLANRKFVSFGGIFREYHRKLNLDNAEDGDLVHVEADPLDPDTVNDDRTISVAWYGGYRQYCREIE